MPDPFLIRPSSLARLPVWRWLLFVGGFAVLRSLDDVLSGADGVPVLPAIGVWCMLLGWLWGRFWLWAAVITSAVATGLGFGPPLLVAWPALCAFVVAGYVLRHVAPSLRWNGDSAWRAVAAASAAALVGEMPHTVMTLAKSGVAEQGVAWASAG
ncbi:MAG: hypothetical protein JXQ84_07425, partial [Rhodospirillaceae bacterium]|nr:hypothetical protein [Rhodospirillaceae bacterium]